MRLSDSALVSRDATCASAPRGTSAYAAIAVGIATIMIGTAAVAADAPAPGSDIQVGSNASAADTTATATSETATRETTGTHDAAAAPAASNAQSADSHASDAKGKKHGSKDKKSTATTADEVVVEGKQPEQQQVCHRSQATGTRLRQTVCTTVAQQQANDKAGEQQAQDYLRRMSQQGTIAGPPSSPYIQSGIP